VSLRADTAAAAAAPLVQRRSEISSLAVIHTGWLVACSASALLCARVSVSVLQRRALGATKTLRALAVEEQQRRQSLRSSSRATAIDSETARR